MTDNNYITQLENPINELPSREEIGGKPYDDESAPTPLFPVNNNQNQFEKPDDKANDDIQIKYEIPPITMTDNYRDEKKYKDKDDSLSPRKVSSIISGIISCSIINFMIVIYDLVFHILIEFSPLILIDDVGIIIMAILAIYSCFKRDSDIIKKIVGITIIISFVGLILRVVGYLQFKKQETSDMYLVSYFLFVIRFMAQLCCCTNC